MTAISMMFTPYGFVIAADGRCRSDDELSGQGETDNAQKIFAVESHNVRMAYALTGFSSTGDGKFDLVAECRKQSKALEKVTFHNGHQYVKRFCLSIKQVVGKAKRDGRIIAFSKNEPPEPEEKGRKFKLFFCGYFKHLPFWTEARFYHNTEDDTIEIRRNDFEIPSRPLIYNVGSTALASMMYDPSATVDPRLAQYKKSPSGDLIEYITSYIKACSDPAALEIDPSCKAIGGHIHVAEVSPSLGFRWRIEPKPPSPILP